ncbi:hypothetical protein [Pontibacter sp. G13]|uniref:hypothetical protein n=1 Tax=Pontibacter sp. G13 TaxID=3074898 RepID=UPI0028899D3A|nr:hypothetical protein [Pontibacter sp. G13]WNJ21349.1 hypothetical protein RJD25_12840 [Pontibacter sp. G13]
MSTIPQNVPFTYLNRSTGNGTCSAYLSVLTPAGKRAVRVIPEGSNNGVVSVSEGYELTIQIINDGSITSETFNWFSDVLNFDGSDNQFFEIKTIDAEGLSIDFQKVFLADGDDAAPDEPVGDIFQNTPYLYIGSDSTGKCFPYCLIQQKGFKHTETGGSLAGGSFLPELIMTSDATINEVKEIEFLGGSGFGGSNDEGGVFDVSARYTDPPKKPLIKMRTRHRLRPSRTLTV